MGVRREGGVWGTSRAITEAVSSTDGLCGGGLLGLLPGFGRVMEMEGIAKKKEGRQES